MAKKATKTTVDVQQPLIADAFPDRVPELEVAIKKLIKEADKSGKQTEKVKNARDEIQELLHSHELEQYKSYDQRYEVNRSESVSLRKTPQKERSPNDPTNGGAG